MSNRLLATLLVGLAACAVDDPELGTTSSDLDVSAFVLPALAPAARAAIVRRYDALDPANKVPRGLLEDAVVYYAVNQALIPQQHYLAIADFSRYSGKDRFWLVDLATGAVEAHKVAHGDGSDPDNDGLATRFGNVDGSHMTSLGFYLTGEIYDGTHPHSMRLDGLSADGSPNGMANTNVRSRLVVMHEAAYVGDGNSSQQGRSNGCLALDPAIERSMVDRIHDGTLIYAATSALAAPVGRAVCGDGVCDGAEVPASCPADCTDAPADAPVVDDATPAAGGGCSTRSGGGLGIALGLLALRRRRRA